MKQVLGVELAEDIGLVDELDELGCELGVVVLLDVVDASIVADVEQTILLVEFPISA